MLSEGAPPPPFQTCGFEDRGDGNHYLFTNRPFPSFLPPTGFSRSMADPSRLFRHGPLRVDDLAIQTFNVRPYVAHMPLDIVCVEI